MPPRKEIPALEDSCLRNIIRHIPRHTKALESCHLKSDLYTRYQVIKHLFTNKFMELFECIQGDKKNGKCLYYLPGGLEHQNDMACLSFLFNQHISYVSVIPFRKLYRISAENFWHALERCKGLKILQLELVYISEERFLTCLPQWHNLMELDLYESFCTDQMLTGILQHCTDIRKLRVTGNYITNTSLFHFCKNQGGCKKFRFCVEGGGCSRLGKKLTSLIIYGSKIDSDGLMCALQHLYSLKQLEDGQIFPVRNYRSRVCRNNVFISIGNLRAAYEFQNQPFPKLKLTSLFIPFFVSGPIRGTCFRPLLYIMECCPYLEKILIETPFTNDLNFSSLECRPLIKIMLLDSSSYLELWHPFRRFMSRTGQQLETVSLSGMNITLGMIKIVLSSCNRLKHFSMGYKKCFTRWDLSKDIIVCEGLFERDERQALDHVGNLETIKFQGLSFSGESVEMFLTDLLIAALNVKVLAICSTLVERHLGTILEQNNFMKLEELTFLNADLEHVQLEPLLVCNTNLKQIRCSKCKNADVFVKEHKTIGEVNNFHLKIEAKSEI